MTPIIRPIKAGDLDYFYPDRGLQTVRGWAFDRDGELLGVFGLMYTSPVQAFSTILPEMKRYPKKIVKASKVLAAMMDHCEHDVIAVADESHPNSMNFLARMGFVQTHERYFKWPTR